MVGTMIAKVPTAPREYERKPVLWNAKLHQDGRIWKCKAVDISPGGAKVRIDERLTINSWVLLTVDHVGSFPGEVRWQNDNVAGIRFLEDAAVVEERLSKHSLGSARCDASPIRGSECDSSPMRVLRALCREVCSESGERKAGER
jgi:hypothetical protein